MIQVLVSFGFGSLGLEINDFLQDDQVIQLGYPPNRIDLLLMLSGVDFPQCYSSRIEIEVDGVKLNLIDLENLKKNKKASGRYQDLADLENLSEYFFFILTFQPQDRPSIL